MEQLLGSACLVCSHRWTTQIGSREPSLTIFFYILPVCEYILLCVNVCLCA